MRTYGGLTVLVLALFLAPALCQASSKLIWQPYDPDSGVVFNSYRIEVEDGGTYVVPEGAMGTGRIIIDHPDWVGPYTRANGELFYLPNPDEAATRELIGDVRDFSWPQPGTYELDTYADIVAPSAGPKNRFLAWLLPRAHAAGTGDYVDTIRFTISIGPPLGNPCCSSVLFIPGMQGSELELDDDQIWPPTVWSDDVEQLAVTRDGESVNPVVVGGILQEFYNVPIYSGFTEYLDSLVDDESSGVAEWRALAYDWRLPFSRTLYEGIQTSNGTEDVFETIQSLASESNTGKVTIVAHSMGGLLGKAIIKELIDRGEENLVDAFIMVGTPQLGTPQGAAAMLHGHDQGIPGGFALPGIVVDPGEAREVAQTMSTAFMLMPSARYFSEVTSPVVTFNASSPFTGAWRNHWGESLDTYPEFKEFVIGSGVPRTDPTDNIAIPEVLDASLMQDTEDFHFQYDSFEFPESIRVVQVAGWGLPTVKTIDYRNEHDEQNFEVLFTREGDGTVVYPSATASDAVEHYFFNLETYRDPNNERAQHRDLLNALPIQALIQYLVTGEGEATPETISATKPDADSIDDQLIISTHSPVHLGAHDSDGRFTGVDSNQSASQGLLFTKEEIPGSYFALFGGDQYLFLPKSGSYSLSIKGSGTGPATIETSTFSDDATTVVATYTDIPVTPDTVAELELSSDAPQSAVVEVDANGDGQVDSTITPDNYAPTVGQLIAALKVKIEELKFKNKVIEKVYKRLLLNKVAQLEKKIAKQKYKRASIKCVLLSKQIFWIGSRSRLIEGDLIEMLSLLSQIEKQL